MGWRRVGKPKPGRALAHVRGRDQRRAGQGGAGKAVRSPTNISPHIQLREKGIGDKDVTTIAEELAHNHLLKKLCLDCNHISDAGAEILAGGLKHANALVLHLGANQIGDAGAVALAGSMKEVPKAGL